MDIDFLRKNNCIVLESVSGSKSYGLDLPKSDTDIKGVFILPKANFYGLDYVDQINNDTNDIVFYELRRFIELLAKNNPNLLELLAVPAKCVIYQHPLLSEIKPEIFISKLCKTTFANYALSQIKKAKGLNKKIYNPVDRERKNILHFCFVTAGVGTQPLLQWLEKKQLRQENCGLSALNHMKDMYALFYDDSGNSGYKGIMNKEDSNEVSYSSIPKEANPSAHLYFNRDGYSIYCKDYKGYWNWVEKRNEERYQGTMEHGKNYDAKNMMHVFRLLDMAEEIASGKGIITTRPNRQELLLIRKGVFDYEELLTRAEKRLEKVETLFQLSTLPEVPDVNKIEELLIKIRSEFYASL